MHGGDRLGATRQVLQKAALPIATVAAIWTQDGFRKGAATFAPTGGN